MGKKRPAIVIGAIVHYEDEGCEAPAMIIATKDTIFDNESAPPVVERNNSVHLTVYSPNPDVEPVLRMFNVPHDATIKVGTYHWPDECDT